MNLRRRHHRPTRVVLVWALLAGAAVPTASHTAQAELKAGDPAPLFSAQAALAGNEFTFSLADALQRGPVVLYFYPRAFTSGCTQEAHDFAEALGRYAALGATVVGVSGDAIETLQKFSVSECNSKFAVVSDTDRAVMKAYDSVMVPMTSYASRTSYVITPDKRVLYAYTAMNPDKHVAYTLTVLANWRAEHPAAAPATQ